MQITFNWLDAQQLLKYAVFALISFFLCIQAWDQSPTTDAAILLWAIGLCLSLRYWNQPLLTPEQKKISFLAFIVFAVSLISWIFSDYPVSSKDLEPELRFLLMPLAIIAVSRAGISINMLAISLIMGGISYGCSALYERYEIGTFRVNGDENAVTFGNGAFLVFACISFLFFSKVDKRILYFAPIGLTMALLAAIFSGTRGSFLGLIPLVVASLFLIKGLGRVLVIILSSALIVILLQFPQITSGIKQSERSLNAYFDHKNTKTSIGQRLLQWEQALCMTAEHPFIGSGPRTYNEHMQDPNSSCSFLAPTYTGYYNQAHSLYFQTLATKGILGLICLLLFLIYSVYKFRQKEYAVSNILLASVITMCSYGIGVDLLFKVFMADRHIVLLSILIGIHSRKV